MGPPWLESGAKGLELRGADQKQRGPHEGPRRPSAQKKRDWLVK